MSTQITLSCHNNLELFDPTLAVIWETHLCDLQNCTSKLARPNLFPTYFPTTGFISYWLHPSVTYVTYVPFPFRFKMKQKLAKQGKKAKKEYFCQLMRYAAPIGWLKYTIVVVRESLFYAISFILWFSIGLVTIVLKARHEKLIAERKCEHWQKKLFYFIF